MTSLLISPFLSFGKLKIPLLVILFSLPTRQNVRIFAINQYIGSPLGVLLFRFLSGMFFLPWETLIRRHYVGSFIWKIVFTKILKYGPFILIVLRNTLKSKLFPMWISQIINLRPHFIYPIIVSLNLIVFLRSCVQSLTQVLNPQMGSVSTTSSFLAQNCIRICRNYYFDSVLTPQSIYATLSKCIVKFLSVLNIGSIGGFFGDFQKPKISRSTF